MYLNAKEIIGSNIAVSASKGEILYEKIAESLKTGSKVEVDFSGITDLTTAFLNVAVGHLYNLFTSSELNESLKISNIDNLDRYLLKQVIERVKMNKKESDEFRKLLSEVLEDGDNS